MAPPCREGRDRGRHRRVDLIFSLPLPWLRGRSRAPLAAVASSSFVVNVERAMFASLARDA